MKVIEINSVAGKQSTGRIVSEIKKELLARGHECMIAYGEKDSPDRDGNYHIGSELERYIHAAKARVFDTAGFESNHATRVFLRVIDEYQPDIIHLHNLHGYYLNIELLLDFLAKKKIPIVWTLHDCWAFTGHCSHFLSAECDKWKIECNNCPQKREYPSSLICDRSRTNYLRKKNVISKIENLSVVTPSHWLSSVVQESFLQSAKRYVINNGIDISVFKPGYQMQLGEEFDGKKIVLAVSSVWTQLKGYDDLKVINRLLDKKRYKLVVIGVNSKQQEDLKQQGIFSVTRTESAIELAKWYDKAFVFINPTYEDTFPTVNIEAIASGTPIITYRTGGSPELVFDGCGVVVNVGDCGGIVNALEVVEKDAEHCRKQGEKFEQSKVYSKYVDLLESIDRSARKDSCNNKTI